jgi:BMFP domain-containing protein YqiC
MHHHGFVGMDDVVDEAETAMKSWMDRWLQGRNFVTREEFDAVRAMAEGPRAPECPASLLQGHPDVRAFLDAAAEATLAKAP